MRKISMFLVGGMIALASIPAVASAHDTDFGGKFENAFGWRFHAAKVGTVESVATSSFVMKLKNGDSITVNTNGETKYYLFTLLSKESAQFSDIKVGGKVQVRGSREDGIIEAKAVAILPANVHPAKARGTVTAVNGNNITIESQHQGVPFNVSVNASSTTIIKKDGQATSSMADVTVGSRVKIKGWWDEILNVLTAIKIRIF